MILICKDKFDIRPFWGEQLEGVIHVSRLRRCRGRPACLPKYRSINVLLRQPLFVHAVGVVVSETD